MLLYHSALDHLALCFSSFIHLPTPHKLLTLLSDHLLFTTQPPQSLTSTFIRWEYPPSWNVHNLVVLSMMEQEPPLLWIPFLEKKIVTFFVPSGLFVSTAHPAGLYIEFHFLVYHCHWIVTYTGGAITVSSFCDTEKLYMKALNMCSVKQENKVTVVKISECRISKGSLRWF